MAPTPPHPSKWALLKIRGDASDLARVSAFNFNEQVLGAMEPIVQAAYESGITRELFMNNGIRAMLDEGGPARQLFELHVATFQATHNNQHPPWRAVFDHLRELFADEEYQTRTKERLYQVKSYGSTQHKTLFRYFSDLAQQARDAHVFGREFATLCLRKGGDQNRVHLQNILEQPAVDYDIGKFLIQLQQEEPQRVLKWCDEHGECDHNTSECRTLKRKQRQPAPYKRPDGKGKAPAAASTPTAAPTSCPPDMADRPNNCFLCGRPGHRAAKCFKAAEVRASADPAALRAQYAAELVAQGKSLQPRPKQTNAIHVSSAPAAPMPPPIPARPERLGGAAATVAATTTAGATPVFHEGAALATDIRHPLSIAMSDLQL